jgi:hypothetical protein
MDLSSLRSALEEWQAEHVDRLPIDQVADDLVELELISGLVEYERLRRIAVFDRRGGAETLGYSSVTALLKHRCRMAAGRAHRAVSRSRVLSAARTTLRAWTSGRISTDQATLLLDQAVAVPDQFAAAEAKLPPSSRTSPSPTPDVPSATGVRWWMGPAPSSTRSKRNR